MKENLNGAESSSDSLYYYSTSARRPKMIDVEDEEFQSKKKQKSGYKGVFKCGKKFKAQIQTNGVQNYLGLFDTEIEAARAYDTHARIVLGARAKTNFMYEGVGAPNIVTAVSEEGMFHGRPNKNAKRVYAGVKVRKNAFADLGQITGINSRSQYETTSQLHYHHEDLFDGAFHSTGGRLTGSDVYQDELYEGENPGTSSTGDQYEDNDEPDWRDQIYYWTGLLSFDRSNNVMLWNGSWVGSYTGKPDASEFIRSTNYFEYRSHPITDPESVLSVDSAYMNSQGVRCGCIRPQSNFFQGFYLMDNDGSGQLDKYLDKDFFIEFHARPLTPKSVNTDKPQIYDVLGKGDSDFGAFILTGVFYSDTGLLEMTRQYITDEDPRASMNLSQLRQTLTSSNNR